MTAQTKIALPNWPRLMSEPMAAAYLGIGKTTLRETGPSPKHLGRRILYDRIDLDRWADALSGQPLDDTERQAEGDDALKRVLERIANA